MEVYGGDLRNNERAEDTHHIDTDYDLLFTTQRQRNITLPFHHDSHPQTRHNHIHPLHRRATWRNQSSRESSEISQHILRRRRPLPVSTTRSQSDITSSLPPRKPPPDPAYSQPSLTRRYDMARSQEQLRLRNRLIHITSMPPTSHLHNTKPKRYQITPLITTATPRPGTHTSFPHKTIRYGGSEKQRSSESKRHALRQHLLRLSFTTQR